MNISNFLDGLLCSLWDLRKYGECPTISSYDVALGRIRAAEDLGAITYEEQKRLLDLLYSAYEFSQRPYPCPENAGPVMSIFERLRRDRAAQSVQVDQEQFKPWWEGFRWNNPAPKPAKQLSFDLPQVQPDEQPVAEVSGKAPRRDLRLLCLLDAFSRPVTARRLPAPFLGRPLTVVGSWFEHVTYFRGEHCLRAAAGVIA